MLTLAEKKLLKKRLKQFEGVVPHMYLDSKGYVTVGLGHFLGTASAAQKLKFLNAKGEVATKDEIKKDYDTVSELKPGMKAYRYKPFTQLVLSSSEINQITENHINSFAKELRRLYPGFNKFPKEAQLALFDMIFNMGATRLRLGWPKLNKAIANYDWKTAAKESNRPDVGNNRNQYVRDLFEKAAKVAEKNRMSLVI